MTPSLLVDTLEIGVAYEAGGARKGGLASSRRNASFRFSSRQAGGHGGYQFQILCGMRFTGETARSTRMNYSRKPGFTETRLRPLARRREMTFLPPWVFMRVRNPCVLDRLRRLGWNVRLGMKSTGS